MDSIRGLYKEKSSVYGLNQGSIQGLAAEEREGWGMT
jgi:hypothetical protein